MTLKGFKYTWGAKGRPPRERTACVTARPEDKTVISQLESYPAFIAKRAKEETLTKPRRGTSNEPNRFVFGWTRNR
jgi:hypothetical protein